MYGLQATDLILIMIVALLLFGPKRLPELARAVGKSISEFKNAMDDERQPVDRAPANPQTADQATEVRNKE